MHIRPFVEADYPSITRLFNSAYGDFAKKVEEMRFRDSHYPSECRWARWIAVDGDGQIVGCAEYNQVPHAFDPRKFNLDFAVVPGRYGRGIGGALYDVMLAAVMQFDPVNVVSWAREDMPCRIGFLQHRGFVADMDLRTSGIDLTSFEWSRWQDRLDALNDQGIEVRTLAELGVDEDEVQRATYDLWSDVRCDVPLPPGEVRTPVAFEEWWQHLAGSRSFFPEAYFIALDGQRFVGLSNLSRSPRPGELRTALTGVRRGHRRRGIATALKVHALRFAREIGVHRVITDNAAENKGMLAINMALGFKQNPPWRRYLKLFSGREIYSS